MSRHHTILMVFALGVPFACSPGAPGAPTWSALSPEAKLGAAQQAQLQRARAARDDLGRRLMAVLTETLEAEGAVAAIAVCRREAQRIAVRVATEHDVRIGRTSWKLRNPFNGPPDWCETLLADRPSEGRLAVSSDGALGATFPIVLQERCLGCHGNDAQIPAAVREALAARYPDDAARGFEVGALRGWFWVEVPAQVP